MKPVRLKIGLLVLILPLFFSLLMQFLRFAPRSYPTLGGDFISRFEGKLGPVKQILRGETRVGYLGDHADPTDPEKQRNFQMTQYSLAPLLVTEKGGPRYFVGVLPLDALALETIANNGLTLIRDFGDEVRVYIRSQP